MRKNDRQRIKALIKKGILTIQRDHEVIMVFVRDFPIGCWSIGDKEKARVVLDIASRALNAELNYQFSHNWKGENNERI